MKINPVILEVLANGVSIEIFKNPYKEHPSAEVVFNLNTMTKSHIHALELPNGALLLKMRYNEEIIIEDFDELLYAVKESMHGRDYINSDWLEILTKNGIM